MDFRYKKTKQKTSLCGNYLLVLKSEPSETNQIETGSLFLKLRASAIIISDGLDFFPLKRTVEMGNKQILPFSFC